MKTTTMVKRITNRVKCDITYYDANEKVEKQAAVLTPYYINRNQDYVKEHIRKQLPEGCVLVRIEKQELVKVMYGVPVDYFFKPNHILSMTPINERGEAINNKTQEDE